MRYLRSAFALAVVCAGLVGLPAAGPAFATLPTPPPIVGGIVQTPAGGTNGALSDISCPAAGSCFAVGQYVDGSGYQGMIATLQAGQWTAATAPLPSDKAATPNAQLVHVSCAGTSCVAFGTYTATDNKAHFLVETLASGVWTPTAASSPILTNPKTVAGVSCGASNSCTLVGDYVGTDNLERGYVETYNGTWSSHDVTLPVDAISPSSASLALFKLEAVSCSTSLCQAVGQYVITDGTSRGLAVSITPSAGTVNSTQLPMGSPAEYEFGDLNRVSCASNGQCAAIGSYTDSSSVAHEVVAPVGGGGWAPQGVTTPTPVQTGTLPIPSAVHCLTVGAGIDCLLSGVYTDTEVPAHFPPFIDELASNTWGALSFTPNQTPSSWACGSLSFCVGTSVNSLASNSIVVRSNGTWFDESAADPPAVGFPTPTAYSVGQVSCDAPTSCWIVGTTGGVYESLVEHVTVSTTPAPPKISLTAPTAPFTLASTAKVTWKASAGAGLGAIQVQLRVATAKSGFGAWHAPVTLAGSATSWTATGLVRGDDYCFHARAKDKNAVWSSWSAARCIAVPLDDHVLTAGAHWLRGKGSAFWNGTITSSSTYGAALSFSGAQADRLAIVATKCPSCGSVRVYVGTKLITTVSLKASTTTHRALILIAPFANRTGTVVLRVATSGKSVQVDGLGISRT